MVNQWAMIIFVMMFLVGMFIYSSKRKHLLSSLLSLEYMALILFLMVYLYLMYFDSEMYFSMIFLTFAVCEGALGLSILVSMIRTHGNDFFQSFVVLQC